jgi:DNA-binding PadR family transcriptional regulator
VEARAEGRRRVYALRGEGFAELARWLTPYALLWQGGLDALERHLERRD